MHHDVQRPAERHKLRPSQSLFLCGASRQEILGDQGRTGQTPKCNGKKSYCPKQLHCAGKSFCTRWVKAQNSCPGPSSYTRPAGQSLHPLRSGERSPIQTLTYLDMLRLVPVSDRVNVMQTRRQEHVEIATFFSVDPQTLVKDNGGFRNCLATLVLDKPVDSLLHLKHSISDPSRSDPSVWHVTKTRSNLSLRIQPALHP